MQNDMAKIKHLFVYYIQYSIILPFYLITETNLLGINSKVVHMYVKTIKPYAT